MSRSLSPIDKCITALDVALRSVCVPTHRQTTRPNPAAVLTESEMCEKDKMHVAGLMRVNHAGEVCAQALYQGQALTAKLATIKDKMTAAALEEVDHLSWCEERLRELDAKPSVLNPLWYSGAFMIGLCAGWVGDKWSLGFVAETERQVTAHLKKHITHLPAHDLKTHAILSQMQQDETRHAETAQRAGAAELPWVIQQTMRWASRCMTLTSYYL